MIGRIPHLVCNKEKVMPHVSIKHFPVNITEKQQSVLSEAITTAVSNALNCDVGVISIAMEAVSQMDWSVKVYEPEIEAKLQLLIKKPNY